MGKTYTSPELNISKIATTQMLAASNTSLNVNVDEEEDDVTQLLSREFDF